MLFMDEDTGGGSSLEKSQENFGPTGVLDKFRLWWRYPAVNSFYRSLLLATVTSVVVQAAPEPTLKAGSEVLLTPLAEAKWIQGDPLKAFEPDKVYIFECWATWCGPCIAAIPHLNELHRKYSEKGLRIYGINVWEDGEEKVAKFVKNKGEGMSYPVAYTGKGSEFENQWLKPAGVKGIPHAFVVRNGKLVTSTHPSQLTDEIISALLYGDAGAIKAATELNEIKEKREQIAIKQRQMEICARVIQRFVRCRRFRLTVEAIVAVNRMHRDSNNIYQVMF
jgi:thiol-disulfide isomerase/thioredoxin